MHVLNDIIEDIIIIVVIIENYGLCSITWKTAAAFMHVTHCCIM